MDTTLTPQYVEVQKKHALTFMQKAGFPIQEEIEVALDDKLPFMGYTTEKDGHPLVVVSKIVATKDSVMGLLIHELSHIYRIETNHPSHNSALLEKAMQVGTRGKSLLPYQLEHLHNIINNIEDLYADDISFQVFAQNPDSIFPGVHMNEFFLSWVREPVKNNSPVALWKNADNVVSAAFAKANLIRHHISDTGDIVEKAVASFLRKIDPKVAQKYDYFVRFMVELPEKVSETDLEELLVNYIQEFLILTV